jgi:sarcosine oxidase
MTDDVEIALLRDTLDRYLPGASGPEVRRITCMCTYTPDRDFIIDRHPNHQQTHFGCGFSGRGYKFAPVVGEILVDRAVDGTTRHNGTRGTTSWHEEGSGLLRTLLPQLAVR